MLSSSPAAQAILYSSWLLALAWLWKALTALRGMAGLPDLTRIDPAALPLIPTGVGPDLAVVVPACNEEESIQATLRSLLASTGLSLEIIAVNDRSTDATGARMDEIAAEARAGSSPHSLHVLHIGELPPGWLGKNHAMALAAAQASAPWLLFTDGDVLFDAHAIELALRQALLDKADHLVVGLTVLFHSRAEAAVFAAFPVMGLWAIRLWKVADPRARDFFGAGGFNLVRREVYNQLGGFGALRMEVIEDARFGWMLKRAGYRQRVALGPSLVRVRWLRGVFGIVAALEKNGFAGFRFRLPLAFLGCLGLAVQIFLPLAALALGGWAAIAGLLTYASVALAYFASRRAIQVPAWLALFYAPATAVLLFACLRSILLAFARNGVIWRGTLYPLAELRRHAGRGW